MPRFPLQTGSSPADPLLASARQRARVAVITRTRDRPLMLRRCIESVLDQSLPDWLHLIVNDGGNPHVLALLIAEYAARYRGRVQVIHNPKCLGMQNASNVGVQAASGDYLCIHDDDDTWQPNFLRECVDFLDDQGADSPVQGVVTQTIRVLEEINADGSIDELQREDYLPIKSIDLFAAATNNPFAPIAFLYRRAVHERVGLFDERFSVIGDWDFNLRFLIHYEIGVLERRLAGYHWRHCSKGTVYANTVTDALEVHLQKTLEMRNHYLRLDLQEGRLGLGYLLNTAKLLSGHDHLLWEVRNRSDQAIHEVRKVQSRLRKWEWFITRNRRLKQGSDSDSGRPALPAPAPAASRNGRTPPPPDCRAQLVALTNGHGSGGSNGSTPPTTPRLRVLSFDVFDTALLRRVRRPTDAFLFLEPAVRERLGAPELPVAAMRISAEKLARGRCLEASGHDEVTLEAIYDAFCELAGADAEEHRAALMALELAAEDRLLYGNPPILEACAAAARAGIRVVFASDMYLPRDFIAGQLRRAGYTVADPAEGGAGDLFLSVEHGASKHVGTLYDTMLRELGVEPAEIVHVGDNFHSDVHQAKARGLRAIHWQVAVSPGAVGETALIDQLGEDERAGGKFADDDLLLSLCVGAVRRRRALHPASPAADPKLGQTGNGHSGPLARITASFSRNGAAAPGGSNGSSPLRNGSTEHAAASGKADLWDRLGYEVGGPLYFLFLHWLLRQAREEGIEQLFFLARDGYHLREACDLLAAGAGLDVRTVYMAASRRLLNLPQITALDGPALGFLLTPNPNLKVRHFLTRLGIDPAPWTDEIRRVGFASLDEVITTAEGVFRSEEDHRRARALFASLEREILSQAGQERHQLMAYFQQIGFQPNKKNRLAVVDLGWQASSARALQTLLNARRTEGNDGRPGSNGSSAAAAHDAPHHRLRAFYFATWNFARPAVEAGCRLSSFFFHLDKPASRRALTAESVEIVELFFGAPHPTIVGLRTKEDGTVEPVYGECEHGGAELLANVTRMRERAVEFVRDLVALAPKPTSQTSLLDWSGNGLDYLEGVLERLLRRPTREEASQLGVILARDSFGGSSPLRPLAQPPGRWDRWLHPGRVRAAYDHAFWKRGFLAQLLPREAAKLLAKRE